LAWGTALAADEAKPQILFTNVNVFDGKNDKLAMGMSVPSAQFRNARHAVILRFSMKSPIVIKLNAQTIAPMSSPHPFPRSEYASWQISSRLAV